MILNLTQHPATAEQLAAGVEDAAFADTLAALLTFDTLPSAAEITLRAQEISAAAEITLRGEDSMFAMIGGAPFLMSALENALIERDITPMYAFSVRESAEQTMPDGTVRKSNVFKHLGFVQI